MFTSPSAEVKNGRSYVSCHPNDFMLCLIKRKNKFTFTSTAVTMRNVLLWDVARCNLVVVHQCF
jgi:hypothetical protein